MTNYRKEYNKIYNKINSIAQKGIDAIFDYYLYIDEIIGLKLYEILEDVMITKYNINIKKYPSVNDMKKDTYDLIRLKTVSYESISLNKLFSNNSVYSVGYYFYENNSNKYIGDIIEVDGELYTSNKVLNGIITNVSATVGLSQSILSAIPIFEDNNKLTINYKNNNQVLYIDNIYQCINSYTYSNTNRITPTYSSYWEQVIAPTYSNYIFTDENLTLSEKYTNAINYLKSFTYSIY